MGADGGAAPLFRFVQFEFPWDLGPAEGRYVLRDHAGEADLRVLVIGVLGAQERRRLGRRRPRDASPDPAPVTTTRATLIHGHRVGQDEAAAWLKDDPWKRVEAELRVLNRVIAQQRVAAADPAVREVALDQALVVRLGYGRGEEVADGRWSAAVEPPARKEPRRIRPGDLRPQERLAALLGGRDAALACEELVLRARADLDGERFREAALQVRVALEAAIAELEAWRDRGDMAGRIAELRDLRGAVGEVANAALRGGLPEDVVDDVFEAVGRIEAALRARSAVIDH